MHLVIATRTATTPPTLQLVAFNTDSIKLLKDTNGRAVVREQSSGMGGGASYNTYEAFDAVLSRLADGSGNVANISAEDLATAQSNVGS
jgi:hypothetical protein